MAELRMMRTFSSMSRSLLSVWRRLPRLLRRAIVLTSGVLLMALGAVLLVLPGPGIPLLLAALAVLALEFAWAEALLLRVREQGTRLNPRRMLAHRKGRMLVALFVTLGLLAATGSMLMLI